MCAVQDTYCLPTTNPSSSPQKADLKTEEEEEEEEKGLNQTLSRDKSVDGDNTRRIGTER